MDASAVCKACPYLRSCKQESETPIEGELKGEIPKWLKGCLIRIGSGLLEIGPDKFNHVFDGMALMHRFAFHDGKVTYQNRFLRSDAYRRNTNASRIVVSEFGTRGVPDPCRTIFERLASLFSLDDMTDNDLVNVVMYGNEAFACSEVNSIWQIDTETLDSVKKVDLRKILPIDGAIAHAHKEIDGTVYNIGTSYGLYCYYNVIKFPLKEEKGSSPFDNGSVVCKIPASRFFNPSYYHSFGMTENYIIFVEQPLYLSVLRLAWVHFVSGTYDQALNWDPKAQNRFHIVRRTDGQLLKTTYVATCFFLFHHINAYEEDNHLVIDICAYDKGEVIKVLYVKALKEFFAKDSKPVKFESRARRYVLPLCINEGETNTEKNLVSLSNCEATAHLQPDGSVFCTFEILTGTEPWLPELPRINYEHYNGRKYRYFYSLAYSGNLLDKTYLLKVDVETKKSLSWCEDKAIPSEPVFLEETNSVNQDEDAGVVLASVLYQDDESKVSLLVLDAKTMKEMGRVTFKTSSSVPADFHGIFIPKE